MLTLRFKRLSPTHHQLEYVRRDGSGETKQFETKSLMQHDLLHLAVENEAELKKSFYGRLADGMGYADLVAAMHATVVEKGEALTTEQVVAGLTSIVQGKAPASGAAERLKNYIEATGGVSPGWLTDQFVSRVQERYRHLAGRWKATPFGEALEVTFPG